MHRAISNRSAITRDTAGAVLPAPKSASRSSFYAAMRVLPAPQREAMYAIYAFCRAVDDIADGPEEHASRLAALEEWRADVHALFRGGLPRRLAPLAQPVRTYGLAREDFLAIIDGVEMDAVADIVAPDAATLDLYCDRVASAVGRLAVRVFGMEGEDAKALALHLGRALQLTNILRDIDEDAAKGRLYLPRELLHAAGIADLRIPTVLEHPALPRVCSGVAQEARAHFAQASTIMRRYPLAVVRAPMLMARVYEILLERLLARGFAAPRRPVRAGRSVLLWSVVRYGLLKLPSRASAHAVLPIR
jgi:phytoene synthase